MTSKKGKLIALTARSGAGKDYLASHLINNHNYIRVSFSDNLKKIASDIFPWLAEDYLPAEKNQEVNHPDNKKGLSPREIWMKMDFLRTEIDAEVFVYGAERRIKELLHNGHNVVVTDVRKPHEYKLMRKLDAKIIKIDTTGEVSTFIEEDIIDQFAVDANFTNHKHMGMQSWEKFCIKEDIIESHWINVIPKIIEIQKKENAAFDSMITKMHKPFMWRSAIFSEWAEFLEEVPHLWKWWKPAPHFGQERKIKAIEEFVDVIKFAIGQWLLYTHDDAVELAEGIVCDFVVPDNIGTQGLDRLNNLVNNMASEPEDSRRYLLSIVCAIHVGCELLDISRSQFATIYESKYQLNMERVSSGYCSSGEKEGLESVQPIHDATCFSGDEITHGQAIDQLEEGSMMG